MQNSFIKKISPSIRILILLIVLLILFIAKSIYLILFITTFTIILCLITGKSVNEYVKILKKLLFLLLIFLLIYIIVCNECKIFSIIRFVYKLIILTVILTVFYFNTDFRDLHQGLYGILLPLKKLKLNIEKITYDLVSTLYLVKIIFISSSEIGDKSNFYGIAYISLRKQILLRIINSITCFNRFQEQLKIDFYSINYKNPNLKSKLLLILFIILLIGCMFKEVIL